MDALAIGIISNQKLIRKALICLLLTLPMGFKPCITVDADTMDDASRQIVDSNPDVLLIDVDGADDPLGCVRKVRELSPSTKSLLLARHCGEKFSLEGIRSGGWGLVTKQSEPVLLQQAIQKVVNGEMWFSHGTMSMALQAFSNHGPSKSSPLDRLAPREAEVLALLSGGSPNKEIASRLFLSESTVRTYIKAIYRKLGVTSRLEAALSYADWNGGGIPSCSHPATTCSPAHAETVS